MKAMAWWLLASLIMGGCAKSLEGDVYSREDARKPMEFQWATVEVVKPVVIEGDRTQKGSLAGSVIGGAAAYGVTDSNTRALVTAVGTVAGAVAGQMAEERMTRAQGVELLISVDDGRNLVVVQAVEDLGEFAVGDRVKVVSHGGQYRVSK